MIDTLQQIIWFGRLLIEKAKGIIDMTITKGDSRCDVSFYIKNGIDAWNFQILVLQ